MRTEMSLIHYLITARARSRELLLLGALQGVAVGAGLSAAVIAVVQHTLPFPVCVVAFLWLASYLITLIRHSCDVPVDFGARPIALIKAVGAYATLASALSDEYARAAIWCPIALYLALGARAEFVFVRMVEQFRHNPCSDD